MLLENTIVRLLQYMWDHADQLLGYTLGHIAMVASGLALALLVGIPLGMISARSERAASIILAAANIIQVFPSLALLALLMIVLGLGFYTVVAGLFLYSLLPVIRNTYVGLKQVDRSVTEAGRGVGMSALQLLIKVQLPLSLPFLMAGLRVAAVIAIGVATLAPMIGGDGLGREIYSGINYRNEIRIYAGAIPAALLAIIADLVLGRIQGRLESGVRRQAANR
jgi:osmoprotectant transport system permease protein